MWADAARLLLSFIDIFRFEIGRRWDQYYKTLLIATAKKVYIDEK